MYAIKKSEVKRFANLYDRHLRLLKVQGKSDSTMSAYSALFKGSVSITKPPKVNAIPLKVEV